MAVRTVCKTRRAICIQGALVATGPRRGPAARTQGRVAAQRPEIAKGPGVTGALHAMVDRQGLEPWTLGLRVPCSTS